MDMNNVIAIVWLAVEILSLIAVASIIDKAGYSSLWVAIPLIPVVLTIVLYFQEINALSAFTQGGSGLEFSRLAPIMYGQMLSLEGSVGVSAFSLTYYIDLASTAVAWLFFLYFAFAAWPAKMGSGASSVQTSVTSGAPASSARQGSAVASAPAPASTSTLSGMNAKRFGRTPNLQAAPSTGEAIGDTALMTEQGPKLEYCKWCGKERAVDSFAIHYCGPADRPVAFCATCGGSIPSGSSVCSSCGAAN
jgi:hypothetical protein